MKRILLGLTLLCLALPLAAKSLVARFEANQLNCSSLSGPGRFLILKIDKPGLHEAQYALRGTVAMRGVQDGFFEMWSFFPDGGAYFTKGLAENGPMGRLRGTASAHEFFLPFDATGPDGKPLKPVRLELYVNLSGAGKLALEAIDLVEFSKPPAVAEWWSSRSAGWLGALVGTVMGLCGTLTSLWARRGKRREVVLALARGFIGLGAVALVLAAMAWHQQQPFHVFYPLALVGVLSLLVWGGNLAALTRQYAETEFRRMRALDLAASGNGP